MEPSSDHETDLAYTKRIAEVEWQRLHNEMGSAGFREGLAEGQERTLQQGFNIGYSAGTKYGYSMGLYEGTLRALLETLKKSHKETSGIDGDVIASEIHQLLSELVNPAILQKCNEKPQKDLDQLQQRVQSLVTRARLSIK